MMKWGSWPLPLTHMAEEIGRKQAELNAQRDEYQKLFEDGALHAGGHRQGLSHPEIQSGIRG